MKYFWNYQCYKCTNNPCHFIPRLSNVSLFFKLYLRIYTSNYKNQILESRRQWHGLVVLFHDRLCHLTKPWFFWSSSMSPNPGVIPKAYMRSEIIFSINCSNGLSWWCRTVRVTGPMPISGVRTLISHIVPSRIPSDSLQGPVINAIKTSLLGMDTVQVSLSDSLHR